MVKITLGNLNQDSPFKKAILDMASGQCVVDDDLNIETRLLANTLNFSHPLLTHPALSSTSCSYHYEYDDFDGLLDAAKFIYATLIQVHNPLECEFNIKPSVNFARLKTHYNISFSMDHKKQATEQLSIEQLNSIISGFNGFNFQYQDTVTLEQIITIRDLPSLVNGDLLYQTNMDITQFCKQADAIHKYELRYINRFIGFGVFAREPISKGDLIAPYCGLKKYQDELGSAYAFGHLQDVLNVRIDAKHYGNIARFINHAPAKAPVLDDKRSSQIMASNIRGDIYGLYGNDIVIYTAKRDISKGEQLLNDYGDLYFNQNNHELLIQCNGNIIDSDHKTIKESRKERKHTLQFMSQQGIKRAKWLVVGKPFIVFAVILLVWRSLMPLEI